ncbi:60S ribosomal export protein NMD3 [Entamoeba marina]
MSDQQQQETYSALAGQKAEMLCCVCGDLIEVNPSSMCAECLHKTIDITEDVQKQVTIEQCKRCKKYLAGTTWFFCENESRELMTYLIKRVRGLNKLKLKNASYVWTEEHSKRLKIKLTVEKRKFIIVNGFCENCHKAEAQNTWQSVVQLRQHADHKRTIYFIEQQILQAKAHQSATDIRAVTDGMDVFFPSIETAKKFHQLNVNNPKKLVSQDDHKNTYDFKYAFSVEIVPICRQDLCFFPKQVSNMVGGVGPLVLCTQVSGNIHFIDVIKGTQTELHGHQFFLHPFKSLTNATKLVEYYVVEIEKIGKPIGKYQLADVQIIKSEDFGVNEDYLHVKTVFGNTLREGETALGYDILNMNTNDDLFEAFSAKCLDNGSLPEVILVGRGSL